MSNLYDRAIKAAERLALIDDEELLSDKGGFDIVTMDDDAIYLGIVKASYDGMPDMPLSRRQCERLAAEWLRDNDIETPISVVFRFYGFHVMENDNAFAKMATGNKAVWPED